MSSSCPSGWTPDVFVSFKNDDEVSQNFKKKICKELKMSGIGFRYTKNNRDKAIGRARFAVVVLSTKYTQCSYCLDQLVEILDRRGESEYHGLVVIPVLLDREEDLQIGELVQNNSRGCALAQVKGIPGYKSRADPGQNELITTIIGRLVNEMESLYSYKVFGPFGGKGERYWHSREINGIEALYTDFIQSITFKVDPGTDTNEQLDSSEGRNTYKVKLEDGEEHIINFRGCFKNANGGGRLGKIASSLTFETNRRQLWTMNTEDKEPFLVPSVAGEIIEIFGGNALAGGLTSIGARVKLTRAELPSEDSQPVGLFGSRKGSKWDDTNEHTTVMGIRVALAGNGCVRRIAFLYDRMNGEWSTHGGNANAQPYEEFTIDHSDDYLSSISGSVTSDGITSLTFLTNKKRTKTIGVAKGTHFSSPLTGGRIVGFYGWSDEHLQGIGAYLKPTHYHNRVTSIGPFGGARAWDDGIHTGVKAIYLLIASDIRYIRFVYHVNGAEDRVVTHPEGVSPKFDYVKKVLLNYPEEYLTWISGYTRDDGSIQALEFHTNRQSYIRRCDDYSDPEKKKKYFGYPSTGTNKIVGFHGTWGTTLNSIGAYVEPIPAPPPLDHFGSFRVGSAGDPWDDGLHSHVIGYRVTASEDNSKIESITFMYDDNGSLVEGSRHGGGDPSSGKWVMLNFPEERLIYVEGYWRKERGGTIIHGLKLGTTDGTEATLAFASGEAGTSTSFRIPEEKDRVRRISGFFGRASDTCLHSIGAHVESY